MSEVEVQVWCLSISLPSPFAKNDRGEGVVLKGTTWPKGPLQAGREGYNLKEREGCLVWFDTSETDQRRRRADKETRPTRRSREACRSYSRNNERMRRVWNLARPKVKENNESEEVGRETITTGPQETI